MEFCKIEEENQKQNEADIAAGGDIWPKQKQNRQFENDILQRVQGTKNYVLEKNLKQAAIFRESVYDSFADITQNLSIEDRWWFYELLDEIKTRQQIVLLHCKKILYNCAKRV